MRQSDIRVTGTDVFGRGANIVALERSLVRREFRTEHKGLKPACSRQRRPLFAVGDTSGKVRAGIRADKNYGFRA